MRQSGPARFGMGPTLFEVRLWARLRREQRESFWSLWTFYEKDLLRLCRRRLRHCNADAEDVLREAMIKAYGKLPAHIHNIRNPRGWLFTLTKNTCIDYLRKRVREEIFLEQAVRAANDRPVSVLRDEADRRLLDLELNQEIRRALRSLPGALRETARYRFLRELEYIDIARRLGITQACARKRIQKAREILRAELRSYQAEATAQKHS